MPWKETSALNERMKFITQWNEGDVASFSELCRAFGISRKTGYKWLSRFETSGSAGLMEGTAGRRRGTHRLEEALVSLVVDARKAHPKWGPRKLLAWLEARHPEVELPSASTAGEWLKRYGLVSPRRRRVRMLGRTGELEQAQGPNDEWALDFKGDFLVADGARVYPWTLSDLYSRYLLRCEGLPDKTEEGVWQQSERAFVEFGLPERLRMDNGTPWVTTGIGGLSRLMVKWIRLGMVPRRIEKGHPEQNGIHERMHLTLQQEVCSGEASNPTEQQRWFDVFRREFNDERPHEALELKTPASQYRRSYRPYPCPFRDPEPVGCEVIRRVNSAGKLQWKGHDVHLSKLLIGEPVGIKELGEQEWEVWYGPVWLARLKRLAKGDLRISLNDETERSTPRSSKPRGSQGPQEDSAVADATSDVETDRT